MRRFGYIGVILLLLFLIFALGCAPKVKQTDSELCFQYTTEFQALDLCETSSDCRLTDREHERWRNAGINGTLHCLRSNGGDTDKDVQQSQEDDLSASR